eukprot:CAMPEP_0184712916 /NCGR_PEP_ID=MMETSP0314-20130426/3377_1 /TAXON_ID=38298 /ORGANISM="Rhodella maculata, Strain CCMP 736" /LENGTH=190 /DNA_ID=CAMNT_0027175447 /DNA_START=12 /DNA_END=581 /DNA_ORIENTATION=-
MKEEFFFFPHTPEALYREVQRAYEQRGLPGCVGSIDCVHVGWDRCPASQRNLNKSKEKCPTLSFEVVSNHRRKVFALTCGHPGTRNDKHIARLDRAVQGLNPGGNWMSELSWSVMHENGMRKQFRGCYLISDGGYMRAIQLIFPLKGPSVSIHPHIGRKLRFLFCWVDRHCSSLPSSAKSQRRASPSGTA